MPDSSLSPGQEEALVRLGAVTISQESGGPLFAVDQMLQKWVIAGDGAAEQDGEPPSLTLPDDFSAGLAEEVGDLADVIKELRRPMTPGAVRWKVQAALGAKANPHSALIVPYIDARLVGERLNTVCPGAWDEEFQPVDWGGGRGAMLCLLTVCGVTRRDVGLGSYDAKGLVSDAFKRAAVKFGIGVFLYAQPKVQFKGESGLIRWQDIKDKDGKPAKRAWLTERGEAWLPLLYTRWLHEHGMRAFGAPLDHGDSIAAMGDFESIDEETLSSEGVEEGEPAPPSEERKGVDEMAKNVVGGKEK